MSRRKHTCKRCGAAASVPHKQKCRHYNPMSGVKPKKVDHARDGISRLLFQRYNPIREWPKLAERAGDPPSPAQAALQKATGWVCPVCGGGVAPWANRCPCKIGGY